MARPSAVLVVLVLAVLATAPGLAFTFSGGGYTGGGSAAGGMMSADYAEVGGDTTGRASVPVATGVTDGADHLARLGIVADELVPLVTVVNWTEAAPCAQTEINASATFTGNDAGAGLQCWVCVSTSAATCDGAWSTTETWTNAYDGGFNVSCTAQIDADDFNHTAHGSGIYVWFRAMSALLMSEEASLYTDLVPLQINLYQEESPSIPWYASNASWVNLAIRCGDCGEVYPLPDLTGQEVANYFTIFNSTCGLSQVKLWWTEPGGDGTEYYRQRAPYNTSLTNLNVFAFNATNSTPLEVLVEVRDYVGAFSDPLSSLRIRGYINGTLADVAGTYVGDNTQPTFFLLRPYDYIFRLYNDQYVWDKGPVMITSTDQQTLRVFDVAVTDRVTSLYDTVLFEFSTNYTERRIRLTYNDTVDDTTAVCLECYNTTSSGASVFSNCLPAGVDSGVIDYTPAAENLNDTFLCCVEVEHGSFSDNRTYCEPIRLHNSTARMIDLGLTISDTWHARIAWGVIISTAFIFTASTAELGAVFVVLETAAFTYWGWLDLSSPLMYVVLLLALAAKLGGRTGG